MAGAAEAQSGFRFYEPVEVPGKMLAPATGKKYDELGLYAWKAGGWSAVLAQFDDKTPDGNFVLTHGPEANPQDLDGVFDPRDVMVFMARHAGEQAPADARPESAQGMVAIELIDPQSKARAWAYLAWFEGGAPDARLEPMASLLDDPGGPFVFSFPSHRWEAVMNEREGAPVPTIYMDKFMVKPAAGGNEKNILDRQKVRGSISFLGGAVSVPINEKIVSGGIVAYKPGPVRILAHSCMYPLFPFGIKGPKFYIDAILVDTLSLTAIKMDLPIDPGFLIHEMTLAFGIDLSPGAKGMTYHNSKNPDGVNIDGRMDAEELGLDQGKDEWRLLNGPNGSQLIATRFDPKFLADGQALSTYNDDESDAHPPENFPGDVGAAFDTLVIKSLEPGAYRIDVFGCVPYHSHDPDGLDREHLAKALAVMDAPLTIRVGEHEAVNQGGVPRMVVGGGR